MPDEYFEVHENLNEAHNISKLINERDVDQA